MPIEPTRATGNAQLLSVNDERQRQGGSGLQRNLVQAQRSSAACPKGAIDMACSSAPGIADALAAKNMFNPAGATLTANSSAASRAGVNQSVESFLRNLVSNPKNQERYKASPEVFLDAVEKTLSENGYGKEVIQQAKKCIRDALGNAPTSDSKSKSTSVGAVNRAFDTAVSENIKEGLHLFLATNAGTKYINGIVRNFYEQPVNAFPVGAFEMARSDAFRELNHANGEHTVKLSCKRKEECFTPAMERLAACKGEPKEIVELVRGSLGKAHTGEVYRGARLTNEKLQNIQAALSSKVPIRFSGFESCSPQERAAKDFLGGKYHDGSFVRDAPNSVLFVFYQGSGAREVTSLTEEEVRIDPKLQYSVELIKHKLSFKDSVYTEIHLRRNEANKDFYWI